MTATVFKARVWENANVTGTGTVTLAGSAQPGYQNFAANVASGSLVCYTIFDPTALAWETGIGTYSVTSSPAGTLTRGLSESSTGALINFVGNQCNVTLDIISPTQTSEGAGSAGLVVALNEEGVIDGSMVPSAFGVAVSNGTETFSNVQTIEFDAPLEATQPSLPVIVQSFKGTNNVSLPNPVTVGNYVLAIWMGPSSGGSSSAPSTLGGMPQLSVSSGSNFDGTAAYGQIATSTSSPICIASSSVIIMYEIANVGSVSAATYTPTELLDVWSASLSLPANAVFMVYAASMNAASGAPEYTDGEATGFIPALTQLNEQPYLSAYTWGGFFAAVTGTTAALEDISWADSTHPYKDAVYVAFVGADPTPGKIRVGLGENVFAVQNSGIAIGMANTINAGTNGSFTLVDGVATYDATGGGGGAGGGSGAPSTFRFIGLRMWYSGASADGYMSLGQLLIHAVIGGPQVAVGGTAYATSNYSGAGFAPAYPFALSGSEVGWAQVSGIQNAMLYYDLGAGNSTEVAEFKVIARADGGTSYEQTPILMAFVGSNDGVTWYQAEPSLAETWTTTGQSQTFAIVFPSGNNGLLPVSQTYTASGAIAITDALSLLDSASAIAMTLANNTVDGYPIVIKNYGAGTATVTANIDGTSGSVVTLTTGQRVKLVWCASLTTYLEL